MSHATRIILILLLMFMLASVAEAQETTTAAETETTTTATTTTATETAPDEPRMTSPQIRERFGNVLNEHPPELGRVLALDHSLLLNKTFLSGYPRVAEFLDRHPEVRRDPQYYLASYNSPREVVERSTASQVFETLLIMMTIALIAGALAWLVRMFIEQRRWNRLSKVQSEVHTRILDRFASSEELLQYIRTPAGAKFLESAPIPLHAEPQQQQNMPFSRILWSIQAGVVVAAGSLGMLLVSLRMDKEASNEMFATGVIFFFIGAGFIAAAVASLILSRRLGLWQGGDGPSSSLTEPGVTR